MDRVLTLQAGSAGVTLIAEIMGNHSNIILVDAAGIILGSIKRVTSAVNRYREVLAHRPYVPPPPPTRPDLPARASQSSTRGPAWPVSWWPRCRANRRNNRCGKH